MFIADIHARVPRILSRAKVHGPYLVPNVRHQPSWKRSFHASPKHQSHVLDVCLAQTHTLITGLHSVTGLPWVATLPLLALLVRMVMVTPLSVVAHYRVMRYFAAQPVLSAWTALLSHRIMKENKARGPAIVAMLLKAEVHQKQKSIYKHMGVRKYSQFLGVGAQLPIWLLIIETVREMCGTDEGLLALAAKSLPSSMGSGALDSLDGSGASCIPIETSFASEGGLWFTDLLIPDPYFILPFALSAVMFGNVQYNSTRNAGGGLPTKASRRILNIMKVVTLAIGPLTLQLPSAMLVYWLSSATIGMAQGLLLDRILPRPILVRPCKVKTKSYMSNLVKKS